MTITGWSKTRSIGAGRYERSDARTTQRCQASLVLCTPGERAAATYSVSVRSVHR